jgi:hypothetical protein
MSLTPCVKGNCDAIGFSGPQWPVGGVPRAYYQLLASYRSERGQQTSHKTQTVR